MTLLLCSPAISVENEVDGESFLDLAESDITEMVSKIGLVKRIRQLQTKVILSFSSSIQFFIAFQLAGYLTTICCLF